MRFFLLLASLFAANPLGALTIEAEYSDLRPFLPANLTITLAGPIVEGDADRLRSVLSGYEDVQMSDILILLDSPGGSLLEALDVAKLLEARSEIVSAQVGTADNPDAVCASACVIAFLGADLRYLAENGRIGVHQFSDPSGTVEAHVGIDIAQRLASDVIGLLDRQNVEVELFEQMSTTPADRITWVSKELLQRWRVTTGSVFNERMEYRNLNGKVALHMVHDSLFGKNEMTLFCSDGLMAYAVLHEPELALFGWLALVVDGVDHRIDDYEILNRNDARTRIFLKVSNSAANRLLGARTIGAKVYTPSGNAFWGFEQTIRDLRVREMVESCEAASPAPKMQVLTGVDIAGRDLTQNGHRGVSLKKCQEICMADSRCKAVSYVTSKSWCWPKYWSGPQSPAPGIISAVR